MSYPLPITSPIVITLIVLVLINLALAWRTLASNPKNAVEIFFSLTMLMTALWIAGLTADALVINPKTVSLVLRLVQTAPIWIAFFFYLFTYHFPYKTFQLSRKQKIALLLSASAITVTTFTPNMMITGEGTFPRYVTPLF
jgi:hypothetical protein